MRRSRCAKKVGPPVAAVEVAERSGVHGCPPEMDSPDNDHPCVFASCASCVSCFVFQFSHGVLRLCDTTLFFIYRHRAICYGSTSQVVNEKHPKSLKLKVWVECAKISSPAAPR